GQVSVLCPQHLGVKWLAVPNLAWLRPQVELLGFIYKVSAGQAAADEGLERHTNSHSFGTWSGMHLVSVVTFELQEAGGRQQFLDVLHCDQDRLRVHKVEQDLHGGGRGNPASQPGASSPMPSSAAARARRRHGYLAGEHGAEVVTACGQDDPVGGEVGALHPQCDVTQRVTLAQRVHGVQDRFGVRVGHDVFGSHGNCPPRGGAEPGGPPERAVPDTKRD
ncbi:hypothetical protein JZ751_010214, partial [Albula glossodonta]